MEVIFGLLVIALMLYGLYFLVSAIFFKKPALKAPTKPSPVTLSQRIERDNQEGKKLADILAESFVPAPEDSYPFFMVFDTETTGFVPDDVDVKEFEEFPFPVQLAWAVFDYEGRLIKERDFVLLQPTEIPQEAAKIHKITTEKMKEVGVDPIPVYEEFVSDLKSAKYLIGHNLEFDDKVIKAEFHRRGLKPSLLSKKRICTMKKFKKFCDIPFASGTGTKYPKLSELAVCAFGAKLDPGKFKIKGGHHGMVDVRVTAKCFFEMLHSWEEIQIEKE